MRINDDEVGQRTSFNHHESHRSLSVNHLRRPHPIELRSQQAGRCLLKFDGYRILARIDDGEVRLFTRNGHDWTAKMPRQVAALKKLKLKSAWLDGEMTPSTTNAFSTTCSTCPGSTATTCASTPCTSAARPWKSCSPIRRLKCATPPTSMNR